MSRYGGQDFALYGGVIFAFIVVNAILSGILSEPTRRFLARNSWWIHAIGWFAYVDIYMRPHLSSNDANVVGLIFAIMGGLCGMISGFAFISDLRESNNNTSNQETQSSFFNNPEAANSTVEQKTFTQPIVRPYPQKNKALLSPLKKNQKQPII